MRSAALAILCLLLAPAPALPQPTDIDARVASLVAEISEVRLAAMLRKLASYETRNLMSNPDPAGRGIGAARQWIFDELKSFSPRLQVSFDTYRVAPQGLRILREVELRNVVAVLPGRSPRRIYVSGHYDTVARIGTAFDYSVGDNPAPGANDDGSGTVVMMELARVFAQSGIEFDATLVFAAFAGEEQGLIGAHLHSDAALKNGTVIDAVFNNDIVGGSAGGSGVVDGETVRVFSEGPEDSPSRQLARHIRKAASRYVPGHRVMLIARHDRFGRGGDHTAFNQRGFAAVRFTEANENYARQHFPDDTLEGVSFPYLARNARVNAAAAATLALAPAAPGILTDKGMPSLMRDPSGYDAKLQWKPVAGATGYRIYWRTAWTPDWEQTLNVGTVTEHVLPNISIDDFIFGVAAVAADGHESLVATYLNPPRENVTVKTLP